MVWQTIVVWIWIYNWLREKKVWRGNVMKYPLERTLLIFLIGYKDGGPTTIYTIHSQSKVLMTSGSDCFTLPEELS